MRQAVARPRHRQSVCIHNIHVAATCRPSVAATKRGHMWLNKVASVLGSATKRGHMWLNKVASVLGPLINVLYINWFVLTSSTNLLKAYFKFVFRIIGRKPENIQTNSEARILIKVQCILYQWICLDMLYKLTESFFQISESFFELPTFF